MVINFMARGISQHTYKLMRTSMLIKKKKKEWTTKKLEENLAQ